MKMLELDVKVLILFYNSVLPSILVYPLMNMKWILHAVVLLRWPRRVITETRVLTLTSWQSNAIEQASIVE